MAHNAVAVNDDDGAAAVAFVFAPQAVGFGHLALRVEVGEERECNPAQLLGESLMGVYAIYTEAQDLGIKLLEAGEILLQLAELDASGAGEIQDVKRQHHHFSSQFGEAQRAEAGVGGQRK